MDLKVKRLILISLGVVLIILKILSYAICQQADNDYEKYKMICEEYRYNSFSDDEINNVSLELKEGTVRIWKAFGAFFIKILIGGWLISLICIVPQKFFDIAKEEYWKAILKPDNLIDQGIEAFIFLLLIWDIFALIGEISDYKKMLTTMYDVLSNISFDKALNSCSF
jgi:hypothetical protein